MGHYIHSLSLDATIMVSNFRKFKVALNPTYRIFLNFAKSCVLSCSSKVDNIKNFTMSFLNYSPPKAVIKGVFSRSYCCYGNLLCYKRSIMCSPMTGQFFDTMIVASRDKEWL